MKILPKKDLTKFLNKNQLPNKLPTTASSSFLTR